jgi:DNA helicase INO80
LAYLDNLLIELKAKKEKVLIFCQMTKMMDILEEFFIFKKYNYLRLDGSSAIEDRRDMV